MGLNLPTVAFRPIGIIRGAHTDPEATPIQPPYAVGCRGRAEGLRDLDGFSHVILLDHFHELDEPSTDLARMRRVMAEDGALSLRGHRLRPETLVEVVTAGDLFRELGGDRGLRRFVPVPAAGVP